MRSGPNRRHDEGDLHVAFIMDAMLGCAVVELSVDVAAAKRWTRIVKLHFRKPQVTSESRIAADNLNAMQVENLSHFLIKAVRAEGRGLEAFKQRLHFHEGLLRSCNDLRMERVIKNHAQMLTLFDALQLVLAVPENLVAATSSRSVGTEKPGQLGIQNMSALLPIRAPAGARPLTVRHRRSNTGHVRAGFLTARTQVQIDLLHVPQVIRHILCRQLRCARLRAEHYLLAAIGRFATARLATVERLATVDGSLPWRATTQSFSTASILVCQPAPVSRKASSTSGDRRMVMRSFVSAALGRPRSLPCSPAGNPVNATERATSPSVHSGLSLSGTSLFLCLFIAFDLSSVGLAEADDPDALGGFGEDQRVYPLTYQPQPPVAHLAVFLSVIDDEQGGLEIERMHQLEGQTALFNIAGVLGGVVSDFHVIYCMHINSTAQSGYYPALPTPNPQPSCSARPSRRLPPEGSASGRWRQWPPQVPRGGQERLYPQRRTHAGRGAQQSPLQGARTFGQRLLVERSGNPISKSALDSAWQRFITEAMRVGVITESERFALHGLKHRGITDSENKASGGHKSEAMRQLYDHEVPLVKPPRKR